MVLKRVGVLEKTRHNFVIQTCQKRIKTPKIFIKVQFKVFKSRVTVTVIFPTTFFLLHTSTKEPRR